MCGLLERREFCEVMEIKDGNGQLYDPERFWTDYLGGHRPMTHPTPAAPSDEVERLAEALPGS